MGAFITFIFYFFLMLFLLGLIARIALRLWFRRIMNTGNRDSGHTTRNTRRPYEKPKQKRKLVDEQEGEYINFEEIE